MLKKISLIAVLALLVTSLVACGGSNPNIIAEDNPKIPMTDMFIPAGVDAKIEESLGYYETNMSLKELQGFYKDVLKAEKGIIVAEKTGEELEKEEILPEGGLVEGDSTNDTIVWVMIGTYGEEKVPFGVAIAEQNGTHGVSVGVGYRARLMARGAHIELPSNEESGEETSGQSK